MNREQWENKRNLFTHVLKKKGIDFYIYDNELDGENWYASREFVFPDGDYIRLVRWEGSQFGVYVGNREREL